ncbi:hypothetical protein E2C01_035932 [Portunus trituberculatus]|uniref:Uncharacterized protein n=1 Tax=Portunus trituberculatus TaxID=210409 RepID=A0A5B7F7A7_PORTR|nr:hypothetical protein [Portunus trituberculatus]
MTITFKVLFSAPHEKGRSFKFCEVKQREKRSASRVTVANIKATSSILLCQGRVGGQSTCGLRHQEKDADLRAGHL